MMIKMTTIRVLYSTRVVLKGKGFITYWQTAPIDDKQGILLLWLFSRN